MATRTALIIFLALIAIVSVNGCRHEDPKDNVDHHIYLAENYVRQGQLKAAMIEAKTVLQLTPGNPRGIYVIAKTMLISGDAKSAEKRLAELVKTDPSNKQYAFSLVEALIKLKKQHSAAFELTEYEKAGGELTAEYYVLQGKSHILAQDIEKAKQSFRQALKVLPDHPDGFLGLAKLAHFDGKTVESEAFLQKVLDSSPEHLDTWLWKAAVAMDTKQYQAAEESFSNALLEMQRFDTMTSTKYLTLNGLVKALIAQGKTDDALRYSETLSKSPQGKLQSSFKDAVGAFRTGDFSVAEKTFQEILEIAPGHGVTGTALGIIKYQQGDFVEAENYLTQALEGGNEVPDQAYKLLAVTRLKLNLPEESLDIIANGLKTLGEDAELYSIQGLAYLQLENFDESRKSLNKALSIAPDSLPVLVTMASLHAKEKNFKDAWVIYEDILKKDPNSMIALKGAIDTSLAQSKLENGVQLLKSIIKKNPKTINPILVLSASYLRDRQFDKAIDYAQQAYQIKPENNKVIRLLATTYYAESRRLIAVKDLPGALNFIRKAYEKAPSAMPVVLTYINLEIRSDNTEAAEKIAQKFIQSNPESHQGFEILGDIQIKQSNFIEAVANLEKAWEISQNHLLGIKLFRAQNALRQDDDAIKHLHQWITSSDNHAESLFTLAMAYQEMDRSEEAIPQYEAVLQQQPDHIVSLNNLAWLYQEAGHEDAVKLAKKASDLAPKSAAVIDTYGWILVLRGEKEEGISILEKAAKLAPNNKDIKQHLEEAREK
ncbi:MAG: tetratricopeptide repeat protein [Pseudomonadales bacterium]|nr:tetratricopeptide repeat protein [Pseudomonadales bacterium]